MPLAQFSVLKYQVKPQIGLIATKNAVKGKPRRRISSNAAGSDVRAARSRAENAKRQSSQWLLSQAATRFIGASPSAAATRSDHARRSTGLVIRRHRRRAGSSRNAATAIVISTSPIVATKGETIPSRESAVGTDRGESGRTR